MQCSCLAVAKTEIEPVPTKPGGVETIGPGKQVPLVADSPKSLSVSDDGYVEMPGGHLKSAS